MSISSNLINTLSAPLSSVDQLLGLLVPILTLTGQLEDRVDLIETYPSNSSTSSVNTEEFNKSINSFYKRQLGFLQKVILEKLWLDWFQVLEAEEIGLGEIILGRLIVPTFTTENGNAVEIAISSYAVLGVVLSVKTSAGVSNPLLLQLYSNQLERLVKSHSIKEIHFHLFSTTLVRNDTTSSPTYSTSLLNREARTELNVREERWQSIMRSLVSIPTKLANRVGVYNEANPSNKLESVPSLIWSNYFTNLSIQFESLLWDLSESTTLSTPTSLACPLQLFISSSLFPSSYSPGSPSFFAVIFSSLVHHLLPPPFPAVAESLLRRNRYSSLWKAILQELPERDQAKIVLSLLRLLEGTELAGVELEGGSKIKLSQFILNELFGNLSPQLVLISTGGEEEEEETSIAWKVVLPILLRMDSPNSWSIGMARVIEFWTRASSQLDGKGKGKSREVSEIETKEKLVELVMKSWTSIESITKGSERSRTYISILLLLLINLLPHHSPSLIKLSRSSSFLSAVSAHLALLQPTTRLMGMLVAEIISIRTIDSKGELKALDFGEVWNGEDSDQKLVRKIRKLLLVEPETGLENWMEAGRIRWPLQGTTIGLSAASSTPIKLPIPSTSTLPSPAPKPIKKPLITVIDDSDEEDLKPYPLPPAPPESYLSNLQSDDPSLYATTLPSANNASASRRRGKLRAPVYIPELTAYLKGKAPEGGEDKPDEEAERMECGLKEGAGLIRRKAGWGGELDENAVDLAFALMGIQDSFEIDQFETKKLELMIALIASSPKLVAPAIIEQYFFHQYSISQRHTMLTALALAGRELAGFAAPTTNLITTSHPAPPKKAIPEISLFPSKQLPPALHRQLLEQENETEKLSGMKLGVLESITSDLMNSTLSETREEAELFVPDAKREKLLTIRRFQSSKLEIIKSKQNGNDYLIISCEFFILPLINRFWYYLKDSTCTNTHSYVGAGGSTSLLEPIILSKFFNTLTILIHAAQNSSHFLAIIALEGIEFTLAFKSNLDSIEDSVLASQMELLLVIFSASVTLEKGATLINSSKGSRLVAEIKEWAEEIFDWEESKGKITRIGRAAAGILLRIEEIGDRWRIAQNW